jgi:hypothetical protein
MGSKESTMTSRATGIEVERKVDPTTCGYYEVTLSEWGGEPFTVHVTATDADAAKDRAARVARKEGRPAACAIGVVFEGQGGSLEAI